MKKLLGWIVNRWTIAILGLVIIAVLIWVFGPAFAFDGHVPLASASARVITILIVVLGWLGYQFVKTLRQRQANKVMLEELTQAPLLEDPRDTASREEREALAARFQDALATLKSARLGGRGGRRHLYQLPWYLMIGPPGSGKTTALTNSGLRFPLADRFGKDAVRGIGGTRNCDWFFTDEAVLIDTAGRYIIQDSEEAVDRAAWKSFLDLLRKHRRQRPIDGLIVALSVTDLVKRDVSDRLAHARAVKRRIQEAYTLLQVRAPVYVIFTKCDLIAGFKEYFGNLGAEERNQVWGVTFGLEESRDLGQLLASLPHEFDRLIERLAARQLTRIEEEERDIGVRGLILSFPQQMALLKPAIEEFMTEAFGASLFEEPSLLRGVYFTSATQEGSPIDRVISAVAASFGLEPQAMLAFSGQGRSYFLTRLMREVVFKESALVSSTGWWERHQPRLLRAAYGGVGIGALGAIALLVLSYAGNRALLADVDQTVDKVRSESGAVLQGGATLEETVAALSALRNLPGGYGERDQRAPLRLTFGLYQGDKLGDAAQTSYHQALNRLLLPRLLTHMEQRIFKILGQPDHLYQPLKSYLMVTTPGILFDEERGDPEFLRLWIAREFEDSHPGAANAHLREALDGHVQALFERELEDPLPSHEERLVAERLVAEARQSLLQLPLASRIYSHLRLEQGAERLDGWTLAKAVPENHLRFFVRRSNAPMTKGVSRLYTTEGYRDVFVEQRPVLVKKAMEETWMLGPEYERLQSENERAELERKVEELYFADYSRVWNALIQDIDVVTAHNVEQQADIVRLFAQTDSPIKSVLHPIAAQTALAQALADSEQQARSADERQQWPIFRRRPEPGAPEENGGPSSDPAARVDREFAVLHALLHNDGAGPPRIDSVLSNLNHLHDYLLEIQQMGTQGQSAPGSRSRAVVLQIESLAEDQPPPLRRWLESLTTTSAALARKEEWASRIAPECRKALTGRYPFVRAASEDVSLTDFARLFKPGGLIETFSREHVLPFADTSVEPWRWRSRDEEALGLSSASLRMFEHAAGIRDAFFPTGDASPGISFEVQPERLDTKASQVVLEIGDQRVVQQTGPRRSERVQWPPPQRTGARIEFTPLSQIGQTISLTKSGPWALFHLLDEANVKPRRDNRFEVSFDVRGYQADFVILAESDVNPFVVLPELRQFRCLDRL